MLKEEELVVEQLGGLPLIFHVLKELEIGKKIEVHFPTHGNWKGASKGNVLMVWIGYIISTCDHRLSYVEEWVTGRTKSLEHLLGESIRSKDLGDDKLGDLLDSFSASSNWDAFEASINRSSIRVYGLEDEVIQIDPTIGKSFRKVIKDGLFQYGHSKHFRKDLPQFKTVLSNLAESNFPLASLTVSGDKADDGLYIPMIELARKSIEKRGLLWVGDVKLGALSTRAFIAKEKDDYLSPLSKVQIPDEVLLKDYLKDLTAQGIDLVEISRGGKKIGEGYEKQVTQRYEGVEWEERHLVICSESYKAAQSQHLAKQLAKAKVEILDLNRRSKGKKRLKTEEDLEAAVQKIKHKYKVMNFLDIKYNLQQEQKSIRGYKDRPTRTEKKMTYHIEVQEKEQVIAEQLATLGWRVYATNRLKERLSIEEAICLYREEYKIERRIRNLKQEVTRLLPLFLKKDNRIIGLINLLVLVLKVIAAIEFKVTQALKKREEELGGIYPGNPKITTPRPTISKMMNAFTSFVIIFITKNGKTTTHTTPLRPVQLKILDLMGIQPTIFTHFDKKVEILFSQ